MGWGWWMVEFGVAGGYLDGSFDLMVALIYTVGSVDLLIVSLPRYTRHHRWSLIPISSSRIYSFLMESFFFLFF